MRPISLATKKLLSVLRIERVRQLATVFRVAKPSTSSTEKIGDEYHCEDQENMD